MLLLLCLGLVNSAPPYFRPPDHVEGLPMERDGHLNFKLRNELIIEKEIVKDPKEVLTKVFKRADINKDNFLNIEEVEIWVAAKIKDHFNKAIKENLLLFTKLDKNHDGRVIWEEYHHNFLLDQGLHPEFVANHSKDHKPLSRLVKEKILLDKAAWSEAANQDLDSLNIDEFLTFLHPEHSHVTLLAMVNDIISNLDTNGDDVLSLEEFVEMPAESAITSDISEEKLKQERKKEFKEMIDLNHDGKITRQELLIYNDLENSMMAKREARKLIFIADVNRDGKLNLQEMLDKQDLFLGSKMIDSARSFHDEF